MRLNLYAGVSCTVHTGGRERVATWYDAPNGFYPDGEPQRWARNREVWIGYELTLTLTLSLTLTLALEVWLAYEFWALLTLTLTQP